MSGPGMCSECGGLVWRDVDHDCPPATVAYTSTSACSQAGLQSYVGRGSITFPSLDLRDVGVVTRHGS